MCAHHRLQVWRSHFEPQPRVRDAPELGFLGAFLCDLQPPPFPIGRVLFALRPELRLLQLPLQSIQLSARGPFTRFDFHCGLQRGGCCSALALGLSHLLGAHLEPLQLRHQPQPALSFALLADVIGWR